MIFLTVEFLKFKSRTGMITSSKSKQIQSNRTLINLNRSFNTEPVKNSKHALSEFHVEFHLKRFGRIKLKDESMSELCALLR